MTFSCSADSHPPSRYSWFLNSTKVGEGPALTRAVSPDSGGRYTCMASNEITGSSSNVSLELTLKCELKCLHIMYLLYCMNKFGYSTGRSANLLSSYIESYGKVNFFSKYHLWFIQNKEMRTNRVWIDIRGSMMTEFSFLSKLPL